MLSLVCGRSRALGASTIHRGGLSYGSSSFSKSSLTCAPIALRNMQRQSFGSGSSTESDPDNTIMGAAQRLRSFAGMLKLWARATRANRSEGPNQGLNYHEYMPRKEAMEVIDARNQLLYAIPSYAVLVLPGAAIMFPMLLLFVPRMMPRVLCTPKVNARHDEADAVALSERYLDVVRSLNKLGVTSNLSSSQFKALHAVTLKAMAGGNQAVRNKDLLEANILSCFPCLYDLVMTDASTPGTIALRSATEEDADHLLVLYQAMPGFKVFPPRLLPKSLIQTSLFMFHNDILCDDFAIIREGGVRELDEQEVIDACRRRGIRLQTLTPTIQHSRAALEDWIEFTHALINQVRPEGEAQDVFPSLETLRNVNSLLCHAAALKYYHSAHTFNKKAVPLLKQKSEGADEANALGASVPPTNKTQTDEK